MRHFERLCHLLSDSSEKKQDDYIQVISLLKEAELFCIHPKDKNSPDWLDESEIYHNPDGYKGNLDLPFQTVWFEMADNDGQEYKVTVGYDDGSGNPIVDTLGILVHEVKPKTFKIWSFVSITHEISGIKIHRFVESSLMSEVVKSLTDSINSQAWGLEVSRRNIKIGSGKTKTARRIKRIIHVTPKKNIDNIKKNTKNSIEWTHAWNVRGHWRIIEGVGKDRNGMEGILGHTWVKAHIKGTGELIKKTRIVQSDN